MPVVEYFTFLHAKFSNRKYANNIQHIFYTLQTLIKSQSYNIVISVTLNFSGYELRPNPRVNQIKVKILLRRKSQQLTRGFLFLRMIRPIFTPSGRGLIQPIINRSSNIAYQQQYVLHAPFPYLYIVDTMLIQEQAIG